MNVTAKRKIMLDQALVGVKLESDDIKEVRNRLIKAGADTADPELTVHVRGKKGSHVNICLRRNKVVKDQYYLNMNGNPTTFLTGDNLYGYMEADDVIVKTYTRCAKALGNMPDRVMRKIVEKDININSLEFATYTIPVPDKEDLLKCWYHVYATSYSAEVEKEYKTLAALLNIQLHRVHKEHTSVCLRLMSNDGRELEAMMMAYDKAKEMAPRIVPDDIANRLRVELSLNYGWFRRRKTGGGTIKTVRDLNNYITNRYSGSWLVFLASQFNWALARTCLFNMWEFDSASILEETYVSKKNGISPEAYFALLETRSKLTITNKERRQLMKNNPNAYMAKINTASRPVVLSLDMGKV